MGRRSGASKGKHYRESLWYEQGGRCHWCGEQMNWLDKGVKPHPRGLDCTIDHLDDLVGRYNRKFVETFAPYKRLVLSCADCNAKRGKKSLEERASGIHVTHFFEFNPESPSWLTGRMD